MQIYDYVKKNIGVKRRYALRDDLLDQKEPSVQTGGFFNWI